MDSDVCINHFGFQPHDLAEDGLFLQRSPHAFAQIQHAAKGDANANCGVERMRLNVFVYGVGIDLFQRIGLSSAEFFVHFVCQCVCAHCANVVLNKLVHLD